MQKIPEFCLVEKAVKGLFNRALCFFGALMGGAVGPL